MPSFKKRNKQWQIRFKQSNRSPQEKSESLPLSLHRSVVLQIEGEMNAAYYGGKWDPWKVSWKAYKQKEAQRKSGILDIHLTIEDAVKLFIKESTMENRIQSDDTRKVYEVIMNLFAKWLNEKTLVRDLTKDHAGRWLQSLTNVKTSTKDYYATVISMLYQYLNDKGYNDQVFRYRKKSNSDRATKIKYLTEEQKNIICEYYRKHKEELVGNNYSKIPEWMDYDDLINILFYQGLRRGEIFIRKIRRRDISLSEGKITVTGKGHKTRKTDITPLAADFIKKAYLATNDPDQNLFPHCESEFRRLLKKLAKTALGKNFGWVSPHNLRHSCGTFWASRGVPVTVIQKLLGHSDINTTMIYVHITDETSKNAFEVASNKKAKIYSLGIK